MDNIYITALIHKTGDVRIELVAGNTLDELGNRLRDRLQPIENTDAINGLVGLPINITWVPTDNNMVMPRTTILAAFSYDETPISAEENLGYVSEVLPFLANFTKMFGFEILPTNTVN